VGVLKGFAEQADRRFLVIDQEIGIDWGSCDLMKSCAE
jgi:hypothetical protein